MSNSERRLYKKENLKEATSFENPLKKAAYATKDFIADYWDLGASMVAGLAWGVQGPELFGDMTHYLQLHLPLFGLAVLVAQDTFAGPVATGKIPRNFYAALSTIFLSTANYETSSFHPLAHATVGVVAGAAAALMNSNVRGARKRKTESRLEKIADPKEEPETRKYLRNPAK